MVVVLAIAIVAASSEMIEGPSITTYLIGYLLGYLVGKHGGSVG
jgi:hypothetical protein